MDLSLIVRGCTLNEKTVGVGVYSQLFERSVSHLEGGLKRECQGGLNISVMSFPTSKFTWIERLFGVNKKSYQDVEFHS